VLATSDGKLGRAFKNVFGQKLLIKNM